LNILLKSFGGLFSQGANGFETVNANAKQRAADQEEERRDDAIASPEWNRRRVNALAGRHTDPVQGVNEGKAQHQPAQKERSDGKYDGEDAGDHVSNVVANLRLYQGELLLHQPQRVVENSLDRRRDAGVDASAIGR
jgi:hypothetical protein